MLKGRFRALMLAVAALAVLVPAVAGNRRAVSSAGFDVSPPQLSSSSAAVGTAVQVSKQFDDDSPAGLGFLYATSGPLQATLGRFVDASAVQNRDGQQLVLLSGLVTITDDSDSIREPTLLLAGYRCEAPGLIYFVFGMATEDGSLSSTGSSILVCGTAATPEPRQSPEPPPVPIPGEVPKASLAGAATPGSRALEVTASFTDDAPAAIVLLLIARGSEGAAHFRSAEFGNNKDGQRVEVKGRLAVLGEDADGVAEMTTVTVAIDCDAGGGITVLMTTLPATGGVFSKSIDASCAGATATIPPPPTLSAIPTALPPCAPTPIAGVACRLPADVTSCPTPPGTVLPTVCATLRPPDTGDGGLMGTENQAKVDRDDIRI